MITAQLWQDALDIQNACNLSGLVHSFPAVVAAIGTDPTVDGTHAVNTHPLVRLWLDKLCDLAGLTVQQGPVLDAYADARTHGAVLR